MLNYAIIGCGTAAKVHIHHLEEHPDVKIVATCDPLLPTDHLFLNLNVPHYQDYQQLLKDQKIDAVSIISPHNEHYAQAIACAEKNIHVLCEKPLALNYDQAAEIVDTFEKRNLTLTAMLPRRFFNNTLALEEELNKETFGKIKNINYILQVNKDQSYYTGWRGKKYVAGGGVLMCQALHDLDRLTYLFGEAKIINAELQTTRKYIDVEDIAKVQLVFPNNIPCTIQADTISKDTWLGKILIETEKGNIILNSEYTESWPLSNPPEPNNDTYHPTIKPRYYGPCHGLIINDFLNAIRENKEPKVSGKSTLPTLKLLFDIYKKAENK